MLYVARDDVIEKEFEDSIRNCFNVKFLGPAEWFLLLRIHQHKDKSYTLDQHCFVLNSLQCCNPNSEFPEPETPFSPDYTFSKDNQPVTDHDNHIIKDRHKRLPIHSAVCMLLSLAYNTHANILFAVFKFAKAWIFLAKPTSVLLSGSEASYNNAHAMPSNSTQTPLQTPSMMCAANIAYHTPT